MILLMKNGMKKKERMFIILQQIKSQLHIMMILI